MPLAAADPAWGVPPTPLPGRRFRRLGQELPRALDRLRRARNGEEVAGLQGLATRGREDEELRRRSRVNEAARAADNAPDFSQRIRASLPGMQP